MATDRHPLGRRDLHVVAEAVDEQQPDLQDDDPGDRHLGQLGVAQRGAVHPEEHAEQREPGAEPHERAVLGPGLGGDRRRPGRGRRGAGPCRRAGRGSGRRSGTGRTGTADGRPGDHEGSVISCMTRTVPPRAGPANRADSLTRAAGAPQLGRPPRGRTRLRGGRAAPCRRARWPRRPGAPRRPRSWAAPGRRSGARGRPRPAGQTFVDDRGHDRGLLGERVGRAGSSPRPRPACARSAPRSSSARVPPCRPMTTRRPLTARTSTLRAR